MRTQRRKERDVPVWMIVSIFSLLAVIVSLASVWVFMNLSKPREVPVPNLAGQSQTEARQTLETLKLRMRIAPSRVESLRVEADRVVDTDPQAGDKVREGGVVTVRLSAGSRYAIVPDLRGMTVDRARSALGAVNLSLDDPPREDYDSGAQAGTILRQEPEPGTKVERTEKIRVTVNFGSPPTREGDDSASNGDVEKTAPGSSDPPATEAKRFTIKVRLAGLTESVDVRVEAEQEDGSSEVIYSGRHSPGDRFEASTLGYGKSMKFRIYYDGELVREVTQSASGDKK